MDTPKQKEKKQRKSPCTLRYLKNQSAQQQMPQRHAFLHHCLPSMLFATSALHFMPQRDGPPQSYKNKKRVSPQKTQ